MEVVKVEVEKEEVVKQNKDLEGISTTILRTMGGLWTHNKAASKTFISNLQDDYLVYIHMCFVL